MLLLGDQVYADEVSPRAMEFIRSKRDTTAPPGEEVADFEEYTRLYWESWADPVIRWLFSTISIAMVIDDHDMHDDWNISRSWVEEMRREPWWQERAVSGLMSYWIYQFIGNLRHASWRRASSTGGFVSSTMPVPCFASSRPRTTVSEKANAGATTETLARRG